MSKVILGDVQHGEHLVPLKMLWQGSLPTLTENRGHRLTAAAAAKVC